ncbi:MAG: hypothetical protein ACLUEK_02650 [Oscillospiraceae bacterium]
MEPGNLAEMKFGEDVPPEFRSLGRSFNSMLERLSAPLKPAAVHRQRGARAAHAPGPDAGAAELFSAEHPDVLPRRPNS